MRERKRGTWVTKHWLVAGSRVSPFLLFSRFAVNSLRIIISDPITLFSHHCALQLYVTMLYIQTFHLKKEKEKRKLKQNLKH